MMDEDEHGNDDENDLLTLHSFLIFEADIHSIRTTPTCMHTHTENKNKKNVTMETSKETCQHTFDT